MDKASLNRQAWIARIDHDIEIGTFKKSRIRKGQEKPLTEGQRALAEKFLPMARALAKPLKTVYRHWRDEFESAACMALVEAARSFDPSRNIKFATFARFRIRGALIDVGRSMDLSGWEGDRDNAPDLVTLTPFNEEHGSVLVAVAPPPVGAEFEDVDAVEDWLRKLPRRHAQVCRLHYLYGKTQAEIAEAVGCSQSEVTRLHRKAIELLAEPYDKDGRPSRTGWRRRRRKKKASATVPAASAAPLAS
jgi:RNA polymerase sigma factor (sigma-70 family)